MTYTTGAATNSKNPDRYPPGAPKIIDRASGAYVWGGGKRYIDLTSGLGSVILGHRDAYVDKAVRNQLSFGVSYPLPSHLEESVAEQLCDFLGWGEKVRWSKNGRDAVVAAVRLARAVTGRGWVFYCDYHGADDLFLTGPPWNAGTRGAWNVGSEKVSREHLLKGDLSDVACVVLEPVNSNAPEVPEPGFFAELRAACDRAGCMMILDEMVSFGRAPSGSLMKHWSIEPDLWVGGKCIANGLPLTAVVGPSEAMNRFAVDVFHSMTHAGEALSLAAAQATLDVLDDPAVRERIDDVGRLVIALFEEAGMGGLARFVYPSRLLFDVPKTSLGDLLDMGVLCAGYANFTHAHSTGRAMSAIERAFRHMLAIGT